jgi:hypothetical protein
MRSSVATADTREDMEAYFVREKAESMAFLPNLCQWAPVSHSDQGVRGHVALSELTQQLLGT